MATYEEGEGFLLGDGKTVDVVGVVHEDVVAAILMQQKDDVVFEGGDTQHGEKLDPEVVVGRLVIVEPLADEGGEVVAQGPRSFVVDDVLLQFFHRLMILLGAHFAQIGA